MIPPRRLRSHLLHDGASFAPTIFLAGIRKERVIFPFVHNVPVIPLLTLRAKAPQLARFMRLVPPLAPLVPLRCTMLAIYCSAPLAVLDEDVSAFIRPFVSPFPLGLVSPLYFSTALATLRPPTWFLRLIDRFAPLVGLVFVEDVVTPLAD